MPLHRQQNSFAGGEISPLVEHRVDLPANEVSCRHLENYIPLRIGGLIRRPGSEHVVTCLTGTQSGQESIPAGSESPPSNDPEGQPVRLIPFNFSPSEKYVIALGDRYWRVYSLDGTEQENARDVMSVVLSTDYDYVNPEWTDYVDAEVHEVQHCQINNYIFFAHPDRFPASMNRFWHSDAQAYAFQMAPMNIVEAGNPPQSNPIESNENWQVFADYGWKGIAEADRPFKAYSTSGTTVTPSATTGTGITLTSSGNEVVFLANHIGSIFRIKEGSTVGTCIIRTVTDGQNATADVVDAFATNTAQTLWAHSAWSDAEGYPRAICFHGQRLWFGGTDQQPTTFWGSAVGDFNKFDFIENTGDSDPQSFNIAADEGSAIQAMVSDNGGITILTEGETWRVNGAQITATAPEVFRQSRNGSAYNQPELVNDSYVMVGRGRRMLYEMAFNWESQSFQTAELSVLAEHLVRDGIRHIAYQQNPHQTLWVVTNDNALHSVTFDRASGIVGWATHPTGTAGVPSTIESVCVVYGDEYEEDQVWVVAIREIGGTETRFIERLDPEQMLKLYAPAATNATNTPATNQESMIYFDSAVIATGTATTSWSAIAPHLVGEDVGIFADGQPILDSNGDLDTVTVGTGGDVDFPSGASAASVVVVGLPYDSKVQMARVEVRASDGTSQTRRFLTRRFEIDVWETLGLEYADEYNPSVAWRKVNAQSVAGTLETDKIRQVVAGQHRENVDLTIRAQLPYPAVILALTAMFEIYGD